MTLAGAGLIPAPHPQPLLLRAETALDAAAALLVVVEVAVPLAGVALRFVSAAPLVWTDELASSLFLWLATLGAVIAARRSAHMRMGALTSKLTPGSQVFLEALSMAAAGTFLLLIMPGVDHSFEQDFIISPAMSIPDPWRAALWSSRSWTSLRTRSRMPASISPKREGSRKPLCGFGEFAAGSNQASPANSAAVRLRLRAILFHGVVSAGAPTPDMVR